MMKKLKTALIVISFLVSGCSHYYYVGNVQNVPLFREKNEMRFSGAYSFGDESRNIEVESAWAFSDKAAIMADFMSSWGGNKDFRNYGYGNSFNAGIGWFKPLNKYTVFEFYGGLGGASMHHEYTGTYWDNSTGFYNQYDGYSDMKYFKLFFQPSIGFSFNPVDIAFSLRLSRLGYIMVEDHTRTSYLHGTLKELSDNAHYFAEPSITLRGGWKYIKAQLQLSYEGYLNNLDDSIGEELHFSTGLYFTIAKRLK